MRISDWSSDVCSSDLDALDGVLGVGGGAHQLDHRKLRNGEALRSAFDDQRRDDGEGERNLDDELGAATLDRGQLDGAADLLDVGAHHVHADAAARDRGPRTDERRVGKEGGSTCRSRWAASPEKKKTK